MQMILCHYDFQSQIRDLESAAPRPPSASQFVAINDHDDDGMNLSLSSEHFELEDCLNFSYFRNQQKLLLLIKLELHKIYNDNGRVLDNEV